MTEDVKVKKLEQALFLGTVSLKYTSLELIPLSQRRSNPSAAIILSDVLIEILDYREWTVH
jgi:hypothetical protein